LIALRNHQYIVEYCDIQCVRDKYILLMEYVEGPTLREILGDFGNGKPMNIARTIRYAIQIAEGLYDAHKLNLVHRDIKPDNIIIEKKRDIPKILDFGIATIQREGCFETSLYRHTRWYSPIELLKEGRGDQRVDIFSFGVTVFEMLTGTLPYFHENATEHQLIECITKQKKVPSARSYNPAIPHYLDRIISKAISPKKEDRFLNFDQLLAELGLPTELQSAKLQFENGRPRVAEKIINNLLQKRPDDSRIIAELAKLKAKCHEYREAGELYEKAITLDPCNSDILKDAGNNSLNLGNTKKAKNYLEKALKSAENINSRRSIDQLLKGIGNGKVGL